MKRLLLRMEALAARLLSCLVPPHLMRNPAYFGLWERRGYHVSAAHFYSPIPDTREAADDAWGDRSALVGIDMRDEAQLALLTELTQWRANYEALPRKANEARNGFFLDNDRFSAVDAEVLYAMIRRLRPSRVIEVGAGFSTRLIDLALADNESDGSSRADFVSVDPYAPADVNLLPKVSRVIESPLQRVDPAAFLSLRSGDLLFIDSSHVLRHRSDVQILFLELIPRLRPGVVVHVHDVFLPFDYPLRWRNGMRRFFNEQYVLQAFLAFNSSFRVMFAARYLAANFPEHLTAAFASFERDLEPGCFWMERVA